MRRDEDGLFVCEVCGSGYVDAIRAAKCCHEMKEEDVVERPAHYNQGGVECIDAIEASMTREEFKGYLKGNVMKYLWRYREKGRPSEDIRKANWYLDRLRLAIAAGE